MSQLGQFKSKSYFDNSQGVNLIDSPFKVKEGQATGGQNYIYSQPGSVRKRPGHPKVNSVADSQLRTVGLHLFNTTSGSKTVVRLAGTKIQALDISVPSFTNMTEDTLAAGSNFLDSTSYQPVVAAQFNTSSVDTLWFAGGGLTSLYGNYSTSKVTKNGADAPLGSISTSVGAGTSTFSATGTYRYAVALRKAGTQALSNASFSQAATIANTTDAVTITLSSITAFDTTKYDRIYIYRSAVSGSVDFTTGDLVTTVASTASSYIDTGTATTLITTVPRAGNSVDNGVLPTGTFKTVTVFKRRLVTATGSTLYLSDINKPESWPSLNTITIPSGGPITGLSVLSFTSSGSNTIDEILCIHKENELWVVTGSTISDFVLKFIDFTGSVNQSAVVVANGFLFWVSVNQVYMWAGTGKPVEVGRLIKPMFYQDGDLDRTRINMCVGRYYKKLDQIIWCISHNIFGEQMFQLKLDLKQTLPSVQASLSGTSLDAVFLFDNTPFPVYAALTYISATYDETLLLADSSGFVYKGYQAESDAGAAISMKYPTPFHDCDDPNTDKRFNKVIVWVEEVGNWNLTLDWWTNYQSADASKSTRAQPLSKLEANAQGLWDVAYWDTAFWDDYNPKYQPLIFNLSSDQQNQSEGSCIKLQFRQEGADEPVTIVGYTIVYTDKGFVQGRAA